MNTGVDKLTKLEAGLPFGQCAEQFPRRVVLGLAQATYLLGMLFRLLQLSSNLVKPKLTQQNVNQ